MKNLALLIISSFMIGLVCSCSKSDVQPTEEASSGTTSKTSNISTTVDTTTTTSGATATPGGAATISVDTTVGVITKPIQGKWSLKNDSTVYGAQTLTVNTYHGTTNDFFDFGADNKLYTAEGAKHDTLAYKQLTDSTVLIHGFGMTFNGVSQPNIIKVDTMGNLSIVTPAYIVPGGYYYRRLDLAR